MIPFASERGGGQDLASHLQNAHDNEFVEVAHIRGAVARDLHGAFAEWEAQAHALTRCKNYLCSLSINPDELQGRISREQYLDYIARTEDKLGLANQPRAVIFHIKDGREHCHVVWSRIDVEAGKAVNLPFYKDKLMTVTREFARDHGLQLPKGYHAHEDRQWRKNRQLDRYECVKQKETGISHEDRMAAVTKAWQGSDSGAAFVRALEEIGYVLATGRNGNRPVLVDIYGHTHALTRLIDDKAVKTRHVRDRLGTDFAPENLPSVEDAQAIAKDRRRAIEDFQKARQGSEQVALLLRQQQERRAGLDGKIAMLETAQTAKRQMLEADQLAARRKLTAAYLAERRATKIERAQNRPKGLAAFLGRVTGISLAIKKLHEYRDGQRFKMHRDERAALIDRQRIEQAELRRRQELQAADLMRERRGLSQIEKKELASLQQALRKEQRQELNRRHVHAPTFALTLGPPGRPAAIDKAAHRHTSETKRAFEEEDRKRREDEQAQNNRRRIVLIDEFTRAAGSDDDDDGGGGDNTGGHTPKPPTKPKGPDRPNRRGNKRRRDRDYGRGM
ncbi:MAG: relaxase/mobilization nuclease domain-containing protein [Alphaproteobacteria bacterium]|nr:relaxase/mobilization nuclease domain-containing protein [Alphaproteobacteria bacterium]